MNCEFFTTTPDILHTAILPVAEQIVRAAMSACSLSTIPLKDNIRIEAYGVATANRSSDHNAPDYASNRLTIQASFSLNPASLRFPTAHLGVRGQELSTSPGSKRLNTKPILVDCDNKIQLHNYDQPMSFGLECKFEYVDVMQATECLQRFRSLISEGIVEYEVDYTYHLPEEIFGLLGLLFVQAGGDISNFKAYLAAKSNNQIGINYNRDDMTDKAISVRCTRAKCVAMVECNQDIPEPLGGYRSPKAFGVNINIQAQVNMPNTLGLSYPIVINNTLVRRELLPFTNKDTDGYRDKEYPYIHIEYFRQAESDKKQPEVLRFPWYDSWIPNRNMPHTPGLIGIFLLDDITDDNPDGLTIINLPTAYPMINQIIWDIYKLVGSECLGHGALVNISVFKDDMLLDPEDVELDNDLNVTIRERDKRYTYRVVLGYDPKGFSDKRALRILNFDLISNKETK